MASSLIDYPELVRQALVSVLRGVLERVAEEGLPGAHHLLIGFRTDHPGVSLPASLRRRYPEEMTVVLQHQFWDLAVDTEGFAVTLRFGGVPTRLRVPFAAVRSFIDPAASFGLDFGPSDRDDSNGIAEPGGEAEKKRPGGTVVDLDAFRTRKDH